MIEQTVHELLQVAKIKENVQHVNFLEKAARRLKKSPALTITSGELQVVLEEVFSSEDVMARPLYARQCELLMKNRSTSSFKHRAARALMQKQGLMLSYSKIQQTFSIGQISISPWEHY